MTFIITLLAIYFMLRSLLCGLAAVAVGAQTFAVGTLIIPAPGEIERIRRELGMKK